MKLKQLAVVGLVASTLVLSGCGAMSTAVKKRNLEVKTQMSETIGWSRLQNAPYICKSAIPQTRICPACSPKLPKQLRPKATV